MLGLATRLPDPLVRFAPGLHGALRLRLDDRPQPARESLAAAGVQQDRIEHGAVDVVLALIERAVAEPDRARALVSGQLIPCRFGQIAPAVDPVHDLQRAVLGRLEVGDELHELVGLPIEVEPMQRLEGEGGIAHPRVAVVPVALTARRLGEGGRERRHSRTGRHVGQALDRQRRALDQVGKAVVGHPRPPEPRAPEARRGGDSRLGALDVLRSIQPFGP